MARRTGPRLLLALLLASGAARAARLASVQVEGLDAAMAANVRGALSLADSVGREVSARRLAWLEDAATREAQRALEPFGYFDATVQVTQQREGAAVHVRLQVSPGMPVRVAGMQLVLDGPARNDDAVQAAMAAFAPQPGAVFDQVAYEASKTRIANALNDHGYFDATLLRHRVEVSRARHAADVDLAWQSGPGYRIGAVRFEQSPREAIDPALLQALTSWNADRAWRGRDLARLRESLLRLGWFTRVDIAPDRAAAQDGVMPALARLTLAPRSVYRAGVSYGTDTGAGISLGLERRYLNRQGHGFSTDAEWSQRRKRLGAQYRIPSFTWLDGWYVLAAQAVDEQTDYLDTRRIELSASREAQMNPFLYARLGLHALRERWGFYRTTTVNAVPVDDLRYASMVYPQLDATYTDVDDPLAPRNGSRASMTLRVAASTLGSAANLAQAHARLQWFHALGPRDVLLLRGEYGHSFGAGTNDVPPSLRFYAGGEGSIRGYGWREVGPRITNSAGTFALGARNVLTASAEWTHTLGEGPWGIAAFVDTGDAYDGLTPTLRTGIGIGVRWRSPVGPLRLDLAHGLDHPDAPVQLYLSLGSPL
jgi:translocation and assembly module TamA